jgi:diphosphomevalonate decarboxylase
VKFEEKYKKEALTLSQLVAIKREGIVAWRSPSNIALIKYWGKRDTQLPQNPSLSFVLDKSFTETRLKYKYRGNKGNMVLKVDFTFEGKPNSDFGLRVKNFLLAASEYLPFISHFDFAIESSNSFPHSSGIASSASSMSALTLCLVSMEQQLFGTRRSDKSFFQKASFLSRLGSGSASRSVYRDYVVWGKHKGISGSSDEIAIQLNKQINPKFRKLRDAILISSSVKKKISSSAGHQLMDRHPFAKARYQQAKTNTDSLLKAFKTGDEQLLMETIENEALSLHALMMSSSPGFTLLNANSWNIIDKIRQFRKDKNIFLTFTLDAGPNVHLLYFGENKKQIQSFIQKELLQFCEGKQWIDDRAGNGPQQII